MKAAVLNQVGDDKLELRDDVTTTAPGPHEVKIRVKASGICHSDLSAMNGTLPALAPGIVGHEGAGEVVEVGSAVTDMAPGDHVIVSFVPPCGGCSCCLRGQPHLCPVTHATTPEGLADLVQSLTGGEGFDYAFEVVGLPSTIRAAYDAARRGGTAVVVGVGSATAKVEFSPQELAVMEKRLLGCFYGSADIRRDYDRMLAFWRAGRLDLEGMVSRRLTLDEINDGMRVLQGGTVVRQVVIFD